MGAPRWTDTLWSDLAAEGQDVEALVEGLSTRQEWLLPSAAEGWTIAHQIAHLAWTDRLSLLALRAPVDFKEYVRRSLNDRGNVVEAGAAEGLREAGPQLLSRWRRGRDELVQHLATAPDTKVPWFGPPMKPASMATARLMETFAHGQDIADALGIQRPVTDRIRHVCHLGVRTRDYAHLVRGLAVPASEFRVELTGPAGQLWTWGPQGAAQSVTGTAHHFALLVTRRRHRTTLDLRASGVFADQWLDIAQAFAGDPGRDPAPARTRTTRQLS